MSVLIVGKFPGDTGKFREALVERADEFAKFGERARGGGAIHHRFGIGDGYVLVVDEWGTPQHFEKFFGNPDLQAFIGAIGGDPSATPDISVTEAVESADQF